MPTTGLTRLLPRVSRSYEKTEGTTATTSNPNGTSSLNSKIPTSSLNSKIPVYGSHARKFYRPKQVQDYGDGGSFPEIHIPQYPLNMGRKDGNDNINTSNLVSIDVDASGNMNYDTIVTRDANKRQTMAVKSKLADLKEKAGDETKLAMPTEDEIQRCTERTKEWLFNKLDSVTLSYKGGFASGTGSLGNGSNEEKITYKPDEDAPGYSVKQRYIKIVEVPKDPFAPSKVKNKKAPRGPADAPVPVMHSPLRKPTQEEIELWKIPPAISNYKNSKGMVVDLDKRLLAEPNRGPIGIAQSHIEKKEALDAGIRQIEQERELKRKQEILNEKIALEREEEKLRELQQQSALARRNYRMGGERGDIDEDRNDRDNDDRDRLATDEVRHMTEEERMAKNAREKIIRKETEAELRRKRGQINREKRDADRDISEKIALGMQPVATKLSGEDLFDPRLFTETSDGGIYDTPLYGQNNERNKYRYRGLNRGKDSSNMAPIRFERVEGEEVEDPSTSLKSGPSISKSTSGEEEDIFGINNIIEQAQKTHNGGEDVERDKKRQRQN